MLLLRCQPPHPAPPASPPSPPAGTDPTEGSALGIALLRALVAGGPGGAALVLASTHHGALTSLKYEAGPDGRDEQRFENASGACVDLLGGRYELNVIEVPRCRKEMQNLRERIYEMQLLIWRCAVEFDEAKMAPTYRCVCTWRVWI